MQTQKYSIQQPLIESQFVWVKDRDIAIPEIQRPMRSAAYGRIGWGAFAVVVLGVLVSCAGRQRHVLLSEIRDAHVVPPGKVVRIYVDRYGDVYPETGVYIHYSGFFNPESKGTTISRHHLSGSLDYYFTGRWSDTDRSLMDTKVDQRARMELLCRRYGQDPAGHPGANFDEIQKAILDSLARGVKSLLSPAQGGTVVLLIHGINDPNPTGDYGRLRKAIANRPGMDGPVFVEVYWDGLTANQGDPSMNRIWGRAQQNSALVAITIRKLINRLDQDTRIRVLTHSLGASVGTGALFDCRSKWPGRGKDIPTYLDLLASEEAPRHADIRIGMLAPAIPGVATFCDFNCRGWDSTATPGNIDRVVVGHNWNDYAVTKRYAGRDWLSKWPGATTLGSDSETSGRGEVERTKEVLLGLGYGSSIEQLYRPIAFNRYDRKCCPEPHGVVYYMERPAFDLFLQALFD